MADAKTGDFNADEYLAAQSSDINARRNKKRKILKELGQEGTFVTKPYTIKRTDAGFEMKGQGAADVRLTGPRPQRPDQIIQDPKPKE